MTSVDTAEQEANEVLYSFLVEPEELTNAATAKGITIVSNTLIPWQDPTATTEKTDEPQVTWNGHTMLVEVDQPIELNDTIYYNNNNATAEIEADTNQTEEIYSESSKQKETLSQVKQRFELGCECQDETCFQGLNPESVYKHRTNISEMSKKEHEIYLMGAMMACLNNPQTTCENKDRTRLRSQYVYQGKQVCLEAYLYLENCTRYEVQRLRKHIMIHGVTPRVHGSHGKRPNNAHSLDVYRHAEQFIRKFLKTDSITPIQLPKKITYTNLHYAYRRWMTKVDEKCMGLSKFKIFMKERFSHVEFYKHKSGSAEGCEEKGQTVFEQQIIQENFTAPFMPMGYDNSAGGYEEKGQNVLGQQITQETFTTPVMPVVYANSAGGYEEKDQTVLGQQLTQETFTNPVMPVVYANSAGGYEEEGQAVLEQQITQETFTTPVMLREYNSAGGYEEKDQTVLGQQLTQETFTNPVMPMVYANSSGGCEEKDQRGFEQQIYQETVATPFIPVGYDNSARDCEEKGQTVLEQQITQGTLTTPVMPMGYNNSALQTMFLVTPAPQFLPDTNCNLVPIQNVTTHTVNSAFPYQIINTGYVVNEQGNVYTTYVPQPYYTFNPL